ncbi:hypothetical protein LB941_06345 [Ligilactobacillus sp. WILCCON 0076]|uniref:Uncharacterized protein n=1 Tax=Ligilactobacillus ubinensis TaxID=2876789 RepID=A0A9X2FJW6_9LACO|nr:hypothetical protein [Ligilactobacillus ubinensis]MCP0886952.1 hypothetical protein [Ligilactobacillus ubinensis]
MEQMTSYELEHLTKKIDEIQSEFENFSSGYKRAGLGKQAAKVVRALNTLYEELDDKADEVWAKEQEFPI